MKNNKAASNIATVAIFFAIMLVINFLTSLVFNLWPVPIKPTLIHVPVIIASIVYGPRIGATPVSYTHLYKEFFYLEFQA